jgi:oxygen-independent coproporphyrinogen-3 oxidase
MSPPRPDGEPCSIYVHLPYCRRVCPYCDFNVYAARRLPEESYVTGVLHELGAAAERPPWAGRRVETVYLGGGTPSLFSPAAIAALLDGIRTRFALAPEPEITLEANPGTVDRDRLAAYAAAGVNRLSLGAQSFHARHLETLGRDHRPPEVRDAVEAARLAGLGNVSLDLIFAVPGETLSEWEEDLAAAIALAPEQISTYSLTYEEGTPFHAWRARGRLVVVGEEDEAAMAEAAARRLTAAGYARYEISSFARPGFASRHNRGYWESRDYLGLGAGAHSFTRTPAPGRRWTNERLPARYLEAVRTHGLAVAREEHLTIAHARGEFCFCGLRQTAGIDLRTFLARFGLEIDVAFPHVTGLVADGLLVHGDGRLRLTEHGLRHADTVSATFV